jgi:hypothetical protein
MIIFFALQKDFSLMQSHLPIFSLNCWAIAVLLAYSCTFQCFPIVSCGSFKFLGFALKSLIHFELIVQYGERHGFSFSFLHVVSVLLTTICWRDCHFFKKKILSKTFTKLKLLNLCGFMSGPSILFHKSSCLFLCQYKL